jgi:hypothetical protein
MISNESLPVLAKVLLAALVIVLVAGCLLARAVCSGIAGLAED